jgi:hypothetical protein
LLQGYFPPPVSVDEHNYGVDLDDDAEEGDKNQVQVEEVNCDLNAGNKTLFQSYFSPRSHDDCKEEFAEYFCAAFNYYKQLMDEQGDQDDEQNEEDNQG